MAEPQLKTSDSSAAAPHTGELVVEARALKKDYGLTKAVQGISFTVKRGEIIGFLGPNGAGKSTTMKMLTGFLRPTEGSAVLCGIDVSLDPKAAQSRLGYLPESAPLYDDMMVVDFLRYVARLRGLGEDKLPARLKHIAERCGLMQVIGKDIGQLSKGYRQRVGLAQAMIHDPDVLILDEPTSGLDPNQIIEIRELIKELGKDKTVILSTHILPEVQATCSRILIINDGKLVADDTPDNLSEQDAGAVVRLIVKGKNGGLVDRDNVKNVLGSLPGVRSVDMRDGEGTGTYGFSLRGKGQDDPREAIFAAAVSHDFVILDMHRERMSLEDTFRRLTKGDTKTEAKKS